MDLKEEILKEEEKLTKLFHKMLDYKGKKYREDLSFLELLQLVMIYYNTYSVDLEFLYAGIKFHRLPPSSFDDDWEVEVSDLNNLENLKELYETLTREGDSYLEHAYDYTDIDLKENETLEDIYSDWLDKYANLFKEMLMFIGIKKEGKFLDLWFLVAINYPWYYRKIDNLKRIVYGIDANTMEKIHFLKVQYEVLEKYKEDYPIYVEKYKDIIEERKKWLKQVDEVEKKKLEKKSELDSLAQEIKEKEKMLRRKEKDKLIIKDDLDKLKDKYRKATLEFEIGEDPYYKIISEEDEFSFLPADE